MTGYPRANLFWTPKEVMEAMKLVEKYPLKRASELLGRPPYAVYNKLNELGCVIAGRRETRHSLAAKWGYSPDTLRLHCERLGYRPPPGQRVMFLAEWQQEKLLESLRTIDLDRENRHRPRPDVAEAMRKRHENNPVRDEFRPGQRIGRGAGHSTIVKMVIVNRRVMYVRRCDCGKEWRSMPEKVRLAQEKLGGCRSCCSRNAAYKRHGVTTPSRAPSLAPPPNSARP